MDIFESQKSEFALSLIKAREKSGLTLKQVADKLGKASHASVCMWENSKGLPVLDDFVRLCKLYNTTPNDLLGFNGENK